MHTSWCSQKSDTNSLVFYMFIACAILYSYVMYLNTISCLHCFCGIMYEIYFIRNQWVTELVYTLYVRVKVIYFWNVLTNTCGFNIHLRDISVTSLVLSLSHARAHTHTIILFDLCRDAHTPKLDDSPRPPRKDIYNTIFL